MRADFPVILDACVLVNHRVCDLLLRLAESPRMYLPFWSEEILVETQRTHVTRLGWSAELSEYWQQEVTKAFPDSCAKDLHCAVSPDAINEKDRHVVQAALRAGAEMIVTFNLKDFPTSVLEPIGIYAKHPSEFVLSLFAIEPLLVSRRINEMAANNDESVTECLNILRRHLPAFVEHFADATGVILD